MAQDTPTGDNPQAYRSRHPVESNPRQGHPASGHAQDLGRAIDRAIGQMGQGNVSLANLWGPFAGMGERLEHRPYYLDGQGHLTDQVRQMVAERFHQREVPGATGAHQMLSVQGIAVEGRPYQIFRRGVGTVALYIGPWGRDLYISTVSFALGAVSPVRVGLLVLLALTACISFLRLGAYTPLVDPFPVLSLFFSGILLPAIPIFLVYAAYRAVQQRDYLAVLRSPINEFQMDDLTALDILVDRAVRQSLDDLDIDLSLLDATKDRASRKRLI